MDFIDKDKSEELLEEESNNTSSEFQDSLVGILEFVGGLFLLAGSGNLIWQAAVWLIKGEWPTHDLYWALTYFTEIKDNMWIHYPDTFIGLHKIVMYLLELNFSIYAIAIGVIIAILAASVEYADI